MKVHLIFLFFLVCIFNYQVGAQSADTTKVIQISPVVADSLPAATRDSLVVPVKVEEKVVAPVVASIAPKDTIKNNRVNAFKINKRDSTFYSKMLNVGFGPSFLNLEEPLPSYWKNTIGFSIGYSEAITKWLRFNVNLDFVNYKIDKSKYLDAHDARLKKELDNESAYFTPERRATDPSGVQKEMNTILDTNRNFADKYVSFRNNNLGLLQLGVGLQIRPINDYWIQPYGLLGFNVNLTTNSLVLLKSDFSLTEKEITKTHKVYSDGIGDSVLESYTVVVKTAEMKHDHIVYANNNIDGSLGLMFGFGCDVFITKRFGLYGEFRRNVSNNAWKEDYGSFQYGVSTIRVGIRYRIK